MRVSIILVAALVVTALAAPRYSVMFENFKKAHGRNYASPSEEAKRFNVFVENMKKAEKLMKVNPYAAFGANEFADMTAAEFKVRHSAEKHFAARVASRKDVVSPSAEDIKLAAGQKIDWRTKGAVTPIKNQGQCGSCWSFSSTGSIEGQWFLAGHTLVSVSEQELVSCDTVDDGCNGGLMDNAWGWLMTAHEGKIVTEASYPYVSGDGNVPACDMSGKVVGAQIDGHLNVETNEAAMGAWVYANGPMSVAVDATSWQTYSGGILTNCVSSQIDHGVLVVGFDDTNNPPYWIIKNSWGASWGENGYIRVEKGTDQCLITTVPCSSKVAKSGTPAPHSPVTTSAPSSGTYFTQRTCSDDKCSNCTNDVIEQNKCITGGGASFKATCIDNGLLVTTFVTSDCSGIYTQSVNPINQCSIVFQAQHAFKWIENICSGSPHPTTKAPTAPPATTSAPAGGTFIQMQCSDAACSVGCSNFSFSLNTCLALGGGGSAIATCNAAGLLLTEYPDSSSCTGSSVPDQMAINQCLQDQDGTYFENFCNVGNVRISKMIKKAASLKKLLK